MASSAKDAPENSFLVTRWSSKPAEHKLARARANQQRHRERVKRRMAELESDLAKTQGDLQVALLKIERLEAELEAARSVVDVNYDSSMASGNPNAEKDISVPSSPSLQLASAIPPRELPCLMEKGAPKTTLDTKLGSSSHVMFGHKSSPLLPCPSTAEAGNAFDATMRAEEERCSRLRPPSCDESTTRCRDAYEIITAQNYAGVEAAILHAWLRPGFRGALAEGGGCRVENKMLFTLLDHISS